MAPPSMANYKLIWSDDFVGAAGSKVNKSLWNYETPAKNSNNEKQHYRESAANGGLSGNGTLLITPLKGSDGTWTSARLASWKSFTCEKNHKMIIQAEIKLGNNPAANQQGIWPAFWALGASLNSGGSWPHCGEWDILELTNGSDTNLATIHYGKDRANHKSNGGSTKFDRSQFHTFAIKVDRTADTWEAQTIRWYLDGANYFTVTGKDIGTYEDWVILARSPFYILLNVAVGGDFPKDPDVNTLPGHGSGMEVRYVGVYAGTVAS
ncbi:hypothetical protein MFRU_001g00870 [Monilinia fructicola]|nr:hypothetical protein MFRU_001g00870 [Monilinia fructicola]